METNVVFLPTYYRPDKLEELRLLKLQRDLHFFKVTLANRSAGLSEFQRQLVLDRFHHGLRQEMGEVKALSETS